MVNSKSSSVYANPPQCNNDLEWYRRERQEMAERAQGIGLEVEYHAEGQIVAIYSSDMSLPEAWRLLAYPLTFNEGWHWLNAYACGMAIDRAAALKVR